MSRASRSRMGGGEPAQRPVRSTPQPRPASSDRRQQQSPSRPQRSAPAEPARVAPSVVDTSVVPDGIGYHSRIIGTFGALVALGPMAVIGLMSMLVLWGSQSGVRGVIGFALAVFACPTLPLFGFPVATGGGRWLAAIASSALVWAALGHLAARRTTSRAVAGWPEWRREWLRLAIGVWIGAFIGFAIAAIVLTVDI